MLRERHYWCTKSDVAAAVGSLLGYPVTRAKDLFELGLLLDAIPNTFLRLGSYQKPKVPRNSRRLVALTKRRLQWGIMGWDGFAGRLNEAMARRPVSDSELAKALRVNVGTVLHWKAGRRVPEENKLPRIAKVCECNVEDLVEIRRVA